MTPEILAVTFGFVLRLIALLIGCVLIWLGYRLFTRPGPVTVAGDVSVQFPGSHARITGGLPGTFFVVMGTVVILGAVFESNHIETETLSASEGPGSQPVAAAKPGPLIRPFPERIVVTNVEPSNEPASTRSKVVAAPQIDEQLGRATAMSELSPGTGEEQGTDDGTERAASNQSSPASRNRTRHKTKARQFYRR